jgi:hypothetical protein
MYIKRSLEEKISKYLKTPEIIAVTGARQVGKTTLLQQIHQGLDKSLFITFEDVAYRQLFDTDIKAFIELYIKPYNFIFLDEFQYAKNGGQQLKLIFDTVRDKKIFISGSSVLDLTIHAVKYLAGRLFAFVLHPLSFDEYLAFKNQELNRYLCEKKENAKLGAAMLEKIYAYLEEYIVYGGYPRVLLSQNHEEKKEVLRNILNVYLLRDVRDLMGLGDDYKMISLLKALSLQTGNVISYQDLSQITSLNFSSLKKNLNLLERTYIIGLPKPFFTNKRIELVKNPKVYFYDIGLRNAVIDDFRQTEMRQDKGALWENFIYAELIKEGVDVKYWRTKAKAEVDFILNDKIPVEVKSSPAKMAVGKSLRSYIEKYNPATAYIFTRKTEESFKIGKTAVHFLNHFTKIPAAK